MEGAELAFQAPLARFDADEWTDSNENLSGDDECCHCNPEQCEDNIVECEAAGVGAVEDKQSSGSSNVTENFGESCSGSLEDLVNSFDQNVTKCCRSYNEQVEQLAPVQVRTVNITEDNFPSWYTLTGTFGNLMPINWSQSYRSTTADSDSEAKSADGEDDEELCCDVDESTDYAGDDLCQLATDDEDSSDVDNADDVINELESLFENNDPDSCDSPAAVSLSSQLDASPLTPDKPQSIDARAWFEEKVKKLNLTSLMQLSEDLAHAVLEMNTLLRTELAVGEQLRTENQLSRDFITLTLGIERKLQQLSQWHLENSDKECSPDEPLDGLYLSTVVPFCPSDGRPSVQRLKIYVKLLSAIDTNSRCVPRLLTDYILNVLCPAT